MGFFEFLGLGPTGNNCQHCWTRRRTHTIKNVLNRNETVYVCKSCYDKHNETSDSERLDNATNHGDYW